MCRSRKPARSSTGAPLGPAKISQRRVVWIDRSGREIRQLDARDPLSTANQLCAFAGRPAAALSATRRTGCGCWMPNAARVTRFTVGGQRQLPAVVAGRPACWCTRASGTACAICTQRSLTERRRRSGLLASPGVEGRARLVAGRAACCSTATRDAEDAVGSRGWCRGRACRATGLGRAAGRPTDRQGDGRGPRRRLVELNGQFSPDGEWIAYDSDETGPPRRSTPSRFAARVPSNDRVRSTGGSEATMARATARSCSLCPWTGS